MPRLKWGSQVPVELVDRARRATEGSEEERDAFILAYRLAVHEPDDLVGLPPVIDFYEDAGDPPTPPGIAPAFW